MFSNYAATLAQNIDTIVLCKLRRGFVFSAFMLCIYASKINDALASG